MLCKQCGNEIGENSKFCPKCGAKQDTEIGTVHKDFVGSDIGIQNKDTISEYNKAVSDIWPDWELVEKIGEGSFGKVFRAKRNDNGMTFFSAIKIIEIPKNISDADNIRSEIGLDDQSTTSYFQALVNDCVNEIKLMESLKGTENIVNVEDYKVVPKSEGIGWTIFIRMELLTSFVAHTKDRILSEREVIKLGISICNALEYCAKLNIMHRDIKPENIFISQFGAYKLGDFGIARKLEKSTIGMSKKGTYNYMAPEIYNGSKAYDFSADIYSLGIVLYKLLNNNRFPLVDPRSDNVSYQQMEDAFERRMKGAVLPKPLNASDALSSVILMACSYDPKSRFKTSSAFKTALVNVQNGSADISLSGINDGIGGGNKSGGTVGVINRKKTVSPDISPEDMPPKDISDYKKETPKKQKKQKEKKKMSNGKKFLISFLTIIIVLGLTAAGLFIYWMVSPENRLLKALDESNYSEALSVYNDSFSGEDSMLLVKTLESRIEKIKTDYMSGAIEYEVASMEISTIKQMNINAISGEVEKIEEYIATINESRTAFSTAEAMFSKTDYAGAIEQYKKVVEDDTNYEAAKGKLATAIEKYREQVLKEAADFVSEGSYSKAITALQAGLKVIPNDAKFTEQLTVYQNENKDKLKDDAIKTAAEYAEKGDLENAIKTVSAALETNSENVELKAVYDDYSKKYVDSVIANVDSFTKEKNYVSAVEALEKALEVLPDNETLKAKAEEVNAGQPVSLSTLTPINGGWSNWNDGTPEDPFGVTHTDISNYLILSDKEAYGDGSSTEYAEYRLYGKYKSISGSLVGYKDIGTNGSCQLKIYADEKLVYTSPNVGRKTDVVNFEADISGADYIKIEVTCSKDSDYVTGECFMMMNMLLWAE